MAFDGRAAAKEKNAAGVMWRGVGERLTVGDACFPTSGSNKAGPRCVLWVVTCGNDNTDTTTSSADSPSDQAARG